MTNFGKRRSLDIPFSISLISESYDPATVTTDLLYGLDRGVNIDRLLKDNFAPGKVVSNGKGESLIVVSSRISPKQDETFRNTIEVRARPVQAILASLTHNTGGTSAKVDPVQAVRSAVLPGQMPVRRLIP